MNDDTIGQILAFLGFVWFFGDHFKFCVNTKTDIRLIDSY